MITLLLIQLLLFHFLKEFQPIVKPSFKKCLMIPKKIEVYCHKFFIPQFHNENCAQNYFMGLCFLHTNFVCLKHI